MDVQILIGLPPDEIASLPDRFAARSLRFQTDFFTSKGGAE